MMLLRLGSWVSFGEEGVTWVVTGLDGLSGEEGLAGRRVQFAGGARGARGAEVRRSLCGCSFMHVTASACDLNSIDACVDVSVCTRTHILTCAPYYLELD